MSGQSVWGGFIKPVDALQTFGLVREMERVVVLAAATWNRFVCRSATCLALTFQL